MELDPNDRRLKTWGIALAILVAALGLVDFVALKGDFVGAATVSLRADADPGVIEVSRPGEKHMVRITTRRRVRGEYEGQSIAWRIVAPDGTTVNEDSELISHKRRHFKFRPMQEGPHELHIEETRLLGSARGTAHVSVYVNDRRILSPLLGM